MSHDRKGARELETGPAVLFVITALLIFAAVMCGLPLLLTFLRSPEAAAPSAWYSLSGADPLVYARLRVPRPLFAIALVLGVLMALWNRRHAAGARPGIILVLLALGGLVAHVMSVRHASALVHKYYGSGGNTKCVSQLSRIGMMLFHYAQEHDGQLPSTLAEIVGPGDLLSADVLVCPWDETAGARHRERGHPSSFVYVGSGRRDSLDRSVVLAYEDPAVHRDGTTERFHVLWGDGSITLERDPAMFDVPTPAHDPSDGEER